MISRPQPLGILPFPAGLLVLPPSTARCADAARAALMAGALPAEWPAEWAFYREALVGSRDAAIAALGRCNGTAPGDAALEAYNRFVLDGDPEALASARGASDDAVRALVDLAAFVQGAADAPPAVGRLDAELAATAGLAQAAWHLEHGEEGEATRVLAAAVEACRGVSPMLAAQLQSQRAQLLAEPVPAIAAWRDAVQLAGEAPPLLPNLHADLCLGLALALHASADTQRQQLVEAVNWYQAALRAGVTLEGRPETYALVQNNLGLAYVSMPMSAAGDKLRLAVAVQSFREALKVYTQEAYEAQWSSTMLNMANALQYLPSSHPRENLIEAVNGYESLLAVRNRALDPVGYARLLANQANALAHLGMFPPALDKLNEARKLLSWHGEDDAAAALLEQVERINAEIAASESVPAESPHEDAAVDAAATPLEVR